MLFLYKFVVGASAFVVGTSALVVGASALLVGASAFVVIAWWLVVVAWWIVVGAWWIVVGASAFVVGAWHGEVFNKLCQSFILLLFYLIEAIFPFLESYLFVELKKKKLFLNNIIIRYKL